MLRDDGNHGFLASRSKGMQLEFGRSGLPVSPRCTQGRLRATFEEAGVEVSHKTYQNAQTQCFLGKSWLAILSRVAPVTVAILVSRGSATVTITVAAKASLQLVTVI